MFYEYLFIDVTYNIDFWNCGLFIICVLDNNRNLQIVSFGFIDTESNENNAWILENFA